MKYCILDTSHSVLRYCRHNLCCPFAVFTPLPSPSKKEGGKERKGETPPQNAKPECEGKKRKWHYLAKLQGEHDMGVWFCWQKRGPKLQGLRVGFRLKKEEGDNGKEPGKWRSRVKGWALWVHGRSLSQAVLWVWDWGQPAHGSWGCACPAWATAATVLWLQFWHLQWVIIWGGKKFVELYFALIIISISITLLHRHLFIAWVRLYFLSLSCFCCWNPGHSASMANSGLLERFPLSAWLESTPSPWAELSLLLRKIFCRADTARQVCPGMLPSSCASECMFGCHCNNLVMTKREDNQDFLQTQSYNTDSNVAAKFPFPCLKHLLPEKHLQNHCCILLLMTFRIMVFSDFCF